LHKFKILIWFEGKRFNTQILCPALMLSYEETRSMFAAAPLLAIHHSARLKRHPFVTPNKMIILKVG